MLAQRVVTARMLVLVVLSGSAVGENPNVPPMSLKFQLLDVGSSNVLPSLIFRHLEVQGFKMRCYMPYGQA